MARQNLGDLLGNLDKDTHSGVTADEATRSGRVESKVARDQAPRARASQSPSRLAIPSSDDSSNYRHFVRKETRLREDQLNQLTVQARRLNRVKAAGAPRITDNTLIRVAVDLLLARIERASGDDEAAILGSLNQ
jgi:hypothetical protein